MGAIVWSPLAGGWLAGKYRRGAEAPPDSRAVRYAERGSPIARRYDPNLPENQRKLDLVEDLGNVADKAGISLTAMALAFTLAHPAVTSTIIGPRTPQHMTELLDAADVRLDGDTLDAIDELVAPGSVVFEFDRGWSPPWMEPAARRR
jgi:aryl-alcohol dehydrogenase-like predicted oxidoreductase